MTTDPAPRETALDWLRSHLPEPGHDRTIDPTDLRCIRQAIAGLQERDLLLGALSDIENATDFAAAERDNTVIPGWSDMTHRQQLVAHCGMLTAALDRLNKDEQDQRRIRIDGVWRRVPAVVANHIHELRARADTNHEIKVQLAKQLAEANDALGRLRIEHQQLRDAYDGTVANVERHNAYIERVKAGAAKRHPPRTPAEALRHCADFFDDHLSNRDDYETDTEVQDRLRRFADQIDQLDCAYRDKDEFARGLAHELSTVKAQRDATLNALRDLHDAATNTAVPLMESRDYAANVLTMFEGKDGHRVLKDLINRAKEIGASKGGD